MIYAGGDALQPFFLTTPDAATRETLQHYRDRQGYTCLASATPEEILAQVTAAGLRGRGASGRGELAGARWRAVIAAAPGERYLVANGAESSPGSRKDCFLMERFPHRVLEGAIAGARAVGAAKVYLYIKATAAAAIASMEVALAELHTAGDLSLPDFELFRAPDAAVAGEETAVCDALEGFEGRPQVKPPTPSTAGVFGRPTLVINVETLAAVAAILRQGPAAFGAVGPPHARGTALFTLSGDVQRPGVYELPLGTPLRTLITECGGGATGEVVAVLPGGYRSGPLTPAELDTPLEYDAMLHAGTTLGPAHVIVLAAPSRLADLMAGALELAAIGSCRQCAICGEGTLTLRSLAHRIAAGEAPGPLRTELLNWATLLHAKGNCALPTGAAMLARRAVEQFSSWRD